MKKPKNNKQKGIKATEKMKGITKGGNTAEPDDFDRTNPDTLASLIDRYKAKLDLLGYSQRTITSHHWTLRSFLKWTHERDLTKPNKITKLHLESYQRWLHRYRKSDNKPLAISTQKQRLGAIQRLFAWLTRENHILANPASELDLPRLPHRHLPKGLSPQELQRLLNLTDTIDPLGIRDRAIIETFYATAIRRSELINLDLSDLDLTAQTLHIRQGKGSKSRLLPIGKTAIQWLDKYLLTTRPKLQLNDTEQALFISGYGDRLSSGYLGNWMRKMLTQAEINRPGGCHLLRHTCATHMLEGGADIRYIQQMLGHSSLDTTSIYTQVAIHQLQQIYNTTHPSATKKTVSKSRKPTEK
jgi:integrase/recombinase XerD